MLKIGDILICYNDKNGKYNINQKISYMTIGDKYIVSAIHDSIKSRTIKYGKPEKFRVNYIIKNLKDVTIRPDYCYYISDDYFGDFYFWRDHFRTVREERIEKIKKIELC